MQTLCERVRQYEERVWKWENQKGKHIPGYGGFIPLEEISPANDILLPRHHVPDMEVWGGKQSGYCGFKPERPPCENPDYMWHLDHSRNNHYTTTYGQANQSCIETRARLKYRPPIVRPPYPHEDPKAKKGVKGFFYEDNTNGSSEEGKKQSEQYFAVVRPLEGTLLSMNSSRSIKSAVMS
ncbi:hypothetical protein M758_2G231900 [Ceratodon purpureus]|uniref:Uncharacterized protein n=1 Tax=Ceratodon purpureus TaxID=3225 RepID=A0A8T0IYX7_CERPU|nr:hypothetical protein KC19_2G277900 [Ceratodon purpureus]KAG0627841.1 hypothetical protein M758_2G231900 [Ceratodon purpureus]